MAPGESSAVWTSTVWDSLLLSRSGAREGERVRIRKQASVRQCCCCCNHHNKQAKKCFSFLRSVLPSDSLGKSVDSWVGPAGLKGLTVCDSLQQMVVVGGCVYTHRHIRSAQPPISALAEDNNSQLAFPGLFLAGAVL